ncbi:hypothetical protein FQU76_21855 [Streptomyces qinzhouensis]|uniref:Uncharacterized protein n=2 Tax=Streptomyces qinzhouensis TaxID=2599401 RepID=A0A5B8ITU8_9ACTN|nr:hypothetical protein FQU76_21855 [Streptomyces qinzhouensis]
MMHAAEFAKELDKNKVTPGVLGFLVFAGLAVGVWFLMKSMTRHMNRVNFEDKTADAPAGESPETGTTGPGAAAKTA